MQISLWDREGDRLPMTTGSWGARLCGALLAPLPGDCPVFPTLGGPDVLLTG